MADYVQLKNVRTWYDELGDGEPLVLLHGGAVDSRFFDQNIGPLAERFHVYLVDLRGHGHTGDVEGPMSFAAFAEDTIEFLETVVGGPAHLVGHSVGATTNLFVTLQRPDLVRKLVMISGGFHHSAEIGSDEPPPVDDVVAALGESYGEVSPDGQDHYPVVVAKVFEMGQRGEPGLKASDLSGITTPTLVMCSDDDIVTLEHTIEMYRAIPSSELAIVPGTSHFLVQEKAAACNAIITDFLANEAVSTIAPVRRAAPAAES